MTDTSIKALEARIAAENIRPPLRINVPPLHLQVASTPVERFAYNIREACAALGIGRTSLYEMAKKGEIALIKVAGRTVVPRTELERITHVPRAA